MCTYLNEPRNCQIMSNASHISTNITPHILFSICWFIKAMIHYITSLTVELPGKNRLIGWQNKDTMTMIIYIFKNNSFNNLAYNNVKIYRSIIIHSCLFIFYVEFLITIYLLPNVVVCHFSRFSSMFHNNITTFLEI